MARILEYDLGDVIGKGGYSEVRKCVHKKSKKRYALKIIEKDKLKEKDLENIESEIRILSRIEHPNIIKLIDHDSDDKRVYLVTELCEGGELFDRIVQREYYSESDAQKVLLSIAGALKHCHDNHIVHRDLKPENILMLTEDEDSPLKIADFGFATEISAGEDLDTTLGTPNYIAPEMLNRLPYNSAVDMWAFGVIIYVMLCGYPPFYAESNPEMFDRIRQCNYRFDSPYWDSISSEAKDLISKLLLLDPTKRLTIEQVLAHPWMKTDTVATKDITPALTELRGMLQRRRLKRSIGAVIALNKFKSVVRASMEQS